MAKNHAVIGSVTYALKAKKALERSGIRAFVVKETPRTGKEGCLYAIEYDASREMAVAEILRELGITGGRSR